MADFGRSITKDAKTGVVIEGIVSEDPDQRTVGERLSDAISAKQRLVNGKREAIENIGISFISNSFKCDAMSAGSAAAKLQRLRSQSATTSEWIAIDNTIVDMTFAEFEAFATIMGIYQDAVTVAARVHKNNIGDLGSISAVDGYDIEINWA